MDTSSTSSPTLLESLFNHIALPPRLPGKHERSIEQIGHALIVRLLNASRFLRDLTNNEFRDQWDCIRRILQTCKTVHSGGRVNKSSLLTEFRTLEHKDLLILHITEQNAGLLIRRHHDAQGQSVIFEAFEVSPLSESVIASENALQWDFPGCAIAIPFSEFNNASFQDNLATFLEQASTEPIKRFAAHTNKAGSFAFESRDTVDPSLITQMLMTFLEVNGHRIFPPLLRKRVRDDVCWTNGAQNPWRRCSFWLLLRVGIQRHLCTLLGSEVGRVHYKFLICLVLARLLEETLTHLNPELLAFLKAKLCRRLVKLEVDKDRASQSTRTAYEYLFAALGPLLYKTTQNATEHINTAWISLKKTMRRPILPLPCRADPRDLYLTLPNSGLYLQKVLDEYLYESRGPRSSVPYQLPVDYDISAPITSHQRAFAQLYFSLSETETDMAKNHLAELDAKVNSEIRCIKLVKKLETYLDSVAGVYDSNPEQKSIMLLTVMEIWMSIDECAINLFRLIRDYNPGFVPEILDVLQLPHFEDMLRLQKIQNYLKDRNTSCKYSRMTIFSDPTKGCFAEQFFNESDRLQELYQDIKDVAELAYTRKEQEWQRLSTEYENLIKAIAESSCVFTTDEMPPFLRIHDDRHCTKCFLQRKARRVKIQVHEHPLPSNPIQAKAVVFELGCPKAFTRYRDVTWRILRTLACPKKTNGVEPRVLLRDYSELKSFNNSTTCSLSLASESKSFLASHYSQVRFPMGLEAVCLPNGLKYGYFDILTKVWSGEQAQKPTFAHHCRMTIPTNSPFSSYQSSLDITVDRPSSYEVVASQTRCPPGLNVHEFMAYQALFSGKNRRWPAILIELGSSNLNFSTEATTLLISQLALQVGPTYENDTLRTIHRVFRDESFCRRLIDQLSQRLNGISSNWRETHCMEMLIVLILRLCSLASEPSVISAAVKLVEMARAFTFQWINLLRAEVQKATDADTSQRCSRYALWAALLCRRTFDLDAKDGENLQPTALRCFVECSITLQDNLVGDPGSLPALLRNALIRDLKMVYRMRFILRRSIEASPGSMVTAINTMWPEAEGSPARSSSGLEFLPHPYEEWIQLIFDATEHTMQQTIHYHLLEGYLFVDGKPLGKLPAEYRKSMTLRQLFDNQSLLTYPSGLYGMTYMLAIRMYGHQIHLGFHKGKLIIRARVRGTILEFVPQEVFSGSSTFDLPAWLVHDCVHWLDLRTGIMEIRKRPDIWKSKTSNWAVDLHTRQAKRRRVSLVDPQSVLFQQIATIFDLFEYRHHLTVFQPTRGNLSVEMRRLELTFVVNNKSLLESSQLRSEIDPDQDAGTWYGLNSKLVLRDAINPHQRSIIVPTGRLLHKRKGFHVTVTVENNGKYGRFIINNIIGRIDCPAEPLLLYLKAQFHAYTSFVIPDTLTGRTGAEESLHCLKSGYCQPWTSLRPGPYQILKSISELTPKRCYYPKDMKVMQEVAWNEDLTTSIQHDAFRPIIEEICKKSEQLSIFASQKTELPSLEFAGDPHLLHRGYSRRHLYSRSNIDSDEQEAVPDLPYDARDRYQISQGSVKVFETVSLIRKWASKMPTTSDLAGIFQNWPTVGGYDRSFDKMLLSDRLAVQFDLEWGSLVNFCRISEPKDKFRLMFLLAVVSFCNDVDMDIVRTLIAFAVLEDLKALSPPKWPSYTQFRQNQIPSIDHLFPLMKDCCFPYPDDDRDTLQDLKLSFKQRKKFEAAELAHERQTESDCKALAQFLLEQWPCLEPTIEGFSRPVLVNVAQAMEMIRPEWKRLFQNMELSYHIQQVQLILDRHRTEKNIEAPSNIIKTQEVLPTRYRGGEFPSLSRNLLRKAGPALSKELSIISNRDSSLIAGKCFDRDIGTVPGSHFLARDTVTTTSYEIRELNDIINGLTGCQSAVRQQYGRDLMQSLNALRVQKSIPEQSDESINFAMLSVEITKSQQALNDQFNKICRAFEQSDSRVQWLQEGGLWPCITPVTLLEQLRSTSSSIFGDRMKENLVIYALSITALQRLTRMKDAHRKNDTQKLAEEQKNAGHRNWNPLKYPDWLLLEIDANILIRPEQVDVALTTISPASRLNSVLQMNMGQGRDTMFPVIPEIPLRLW
ncbi:MAG: hypothetical protein M1834_002365 [Cirrosporium novae-zelandiae]|nr:MAG: hypothetical protein M1834_002365 [Cirrosporium novae-zelandiae]